MPKKKGLGYFFLIFFLTLKVALGGFYAMLMLF